MTRILILLWVWFFFVCTQEDNEVFADQIACWDATYDLSGNAYGFVTIGSQCWGTTNLATQGYRNGDTIPLVEDPVAWAKLTTGARCYYQNDTANERIYGVLYNWYAVNDPRGSASMGTHIPCLAEWNTLRSNQGGYPVAGGSLKAVSTEWDSPNVAATDATGFNALPGGLRHALNVKFFYKGVYAFFWANTSVSMEGSECKFLFYNDGTLDGDGMDKRYGLAVRVLKG